MGRAGMKTPWHMKDERIGEYVDAVRAAALRWKGKMQVYLGLEVDYIKGLRSPLDSDIRELGLDYSIGSVHYIVPPDGNLRSVFAVDEPLAQMEENVRTNIGGNGPVMMNFYWDAVIEMVGLGGFDIVGHLDLVKKHNGRKRWFDEKGTAYLGRAEEAVRAIAESGAVVEINTGGMNRGYLDEPYPSPAILRLLRDRDVPVTVNADAHRRGDIAGHYREARQFLLDAGYSCHHVFEGRNSAGNPIWHERAL